MKFEKRRQKFIKYPECLRHFHPYRKLAGMLCDRIIPKGSRPKLASELEAVSLHQKGYVREYYVKKTADTLFLVNIILVLLSFILVWSSMQDRSIPSGRIDRPGYGEADSDEELTLSVPGMDREDSMTVHISSRKFTDKEAEKLLKLADLQFQDEVAGDNASLSEVRSPLVLPKTFQDGLVAAEYSLQPGDLIDDETGEIVGKPDREGTPVTIEATFRLQEKERISKFALVLFPPILTGQAKFQSDLQEALKQADEKDPTSRSVRLPLRNDSKKLLWSRPADSFLTILMLLGVLLPAAVWVEKDEKVRQQAKERKERLDLDYSELLFRLTLLIGAGLTIKGAFSRVCGQAEQHHAAESHPVYPEIRFMLREISSGVPEETAYENFGRRCGLPQYIKLGSLLAQNLKKGSRGLTSLLEKEAFLSLQQHQVAARKMGEKASLKMLFPMILMFVDVMLILMVPALLSV